MRGIWDLFNNLEILGVTVFSNAGSLQGLVLSKSASGRYRLLCSKVFGTGKQMCAPAFCLDRCSVSESVLLIPVPAPQKHSHSVELLPSCFTAGMFLKV